MTRLVPRPTAVREDLHDGPVPTLWPRVDPIVNLPIVVLLPHSRCNCRCVMCDIWRSTGHAEIAANEVRQWLPEWRTLGVKRVVLGGGEALLHSHLWEMCELLRAQGLGITVLTTGILLRRDAAKLVRYCDDIVVSLDGPPEVHNAIRNVPRAFDKLGEGVAAVKAANATVHVTGRCTVQQQNFRHLCATVETAHRLGLDRISFLAVDVSTEAFNRPGGWGPERASAVALDAAQLSELAAEIDLLEHEFRRDFDRGYIAESPAKLRTRLYRYFSALCGVDEFAPPTCNAPWVSTVIETDGTVRPCYFQPPLGNVREAGSLDAVLNSENALAWRRGLDVQRNDICRKCVCSLALRRDRPEVLMEPG